MQEGNNSSAESQRIKGNFQNVIQRFDWCRGKFEDITRELVGKLLIRSHKKKIYNSQHLLGDLIV